MDRTADESLPLNPSEDDMRRLLERSGARVLEFIRTLPEQPSFSTDDAAAARRRVDEPPPERGAPLEDVLAHLFDAVVPCALNTAGPGYLAYIPGGGLYSSAVADFIAGAVNRYAGVWAAAPGAAELETQVLRWLAALVGLPAGALGVMTTGGSMSNLVAVVAAREKLLGDRLADGVVYLSEEAHHSLAKAARVAGIPPANLRHVPVDERFALRPEALAAAVAADRRAGRLPFLVCASAGTVNTGAVDPLGPIADIAARESLWLHVDGAYGGAFALVPECRATLAGMERADSIALDPHKGLFLPYGCGVLLAREPAALRAAFGGSASYLPALQDGDRHDFCEMSPELSRAWRGLKLWLPFKLHGVAAFRDALAERRRLAVRLWEALRDEDDIEILAPPALSLFAFRQRFPGAGAAGADSYRAGAAGADSYRADADERNRELLARINAPRRIYATGTTIEGRFALRLCVLHLRTDSARVEEGLEIIRGAVRSMRQDSVRGR